MSFDPIRRDRVVDLDGDFVLDWYFQETNKTATDVSAHTMLLTVHFGGDLLFSQSKADMSVGTAEAVTDERGQSQGTATPVTAVIASADMKSLTAAQKAGPWIYKFSYQPSGGQLQVHDWGECEVLQTERPA